MPRKSSKESKVANPSVSSSPVRIEISPEVTEDTSQYYCNYIEVGHSAYDFVITPVRIPYKLNAEKTAIANKGEPVPVEPLFQLVVPTRLVPGLIRALTIQKDSYEKQYGKIGGEESDARPAKK